MWKLGLRRAIPFLGICVLIFGIVLCLRSAAAKAKSNCETKVPKLLVLLESLYIHIVDKAQKKWMLVVGV
jgi:hypothetical protein